MSKPIFIIRFPESAPIEVLEYSRKSITNNPVARDYHILVMQDPNRKGDVTFECYNSPHTDIEFEVLQAKLLELIKNPK